MMDETYRGGDGPTMITTFLKYPFSDLVYLFPCMSPQEFDALVTSIRERGLLEAIVVWRDEIIDGRHRTLACLKAGVKPVYRSLPDDADPLEFVLAKNGARRDMSISQKAVSACKLSMWSTRGRPRKEDGTGEHPSRRYTQGEAAKRFGVSRRLVGYAARILAPDSTAHPSVRRSVELGRITVNDAGRVLGEPPEVQRDALARVLRGAPNTIAGAVRQVKQEIARKEDVQALEAALARPIGMTATLHHSTVAGLHTLVEAGSVDAIVTHPPGGSEALSLLPDMASFAAHALRPGGVMAVMGHAQLLPQMIERLGQQGLRWIMEFDVQFNQAEGRSGRPHFVSLHRRPLLVYAKPGFSLDGGADVIAVPSPGELDEGRSRWHPMDVAMAMIVGRFSRPGQVVCDPCLLGRCGTALGARGNGCAFIGADGDRGCVDRTLRLLSEVEGAGPS